VGIVIKFKRLALGFAIAAVGLVTLIAILPDPETPTPRPASTPSQVSALLAEEDQLNDQCRDAPMRDAKDEKAVEAICARRDQVFRQLEAKGWCHGEGEDIEANKVWKPCSSASSRTPSQGSVPDAVQFDPKAAAQKAMFTQMEGGAELCMHRAVRGLLMQGVRSRAELLNFAGTTCGQGFKRFMTSNLDVPEKAATAFIDKMALDTLTEELQ
jgi:hypothetical protein